ncbi:MAG: class I fructose-bisphosphate aldolase, partial [Candidatus Paceibacterales bacterium]
DGGLEDMIGHPGDKITKGLEGLPERLAEYFQMGARFAKWRAAFAIDGDVPSQDAIEANADLLAQYALMCQQAGIVPMVEPEVLMDGAHTMEQCRQVTEKVLRTVFRHLARKGVALEGMILKPNMVVPGLDCPAQESVQEVADATVKLLIQLVPANVVGVAFLSGGQSSQLASERLSAMNSKYKTQLPWPLTFSYSRAMQYPALEIWGGKEENVPAAQESLLHRAKLNQLARKGEYTVEMEKE